MSEPVGHVRHRFILLCLLLACSLSACSVREAAMRGLADELASQGAVPESDLELVREASAYHLKLSEAILRQDPSHLALATAVTAGFTQYAYAFVAFEADRLEARDAKGAHRLRERAARLYGRAMRHGLATLELRQPGFRRALEQPAPGGAPQLARDEVGLAYWTAAAWGATIALSKDHPDIVADLPLAARLASIAAAVDPAFGDGALASLVGSFEAASPGGGRARALPWFDRAIALGAGRSVGAFVAKAEGDALAAGDRMAFVALLEQALAVPETPDSPLTLSNQVMRLRAAWLLERVDDLF
jgi:hypothetical protein